MMRHSGEAQILTHHEPIVGVAPNPDVASPSDSGQAGMTGNSKVTRRVAYSDF
jgi:hypothetical protein